VILPQTIKFSPRPKQHYVLLEVGWPLVLKEVGGGGGEVPRLWEKDSLSAAYALA
jgi:hypothetical protein